MRSSAGGGQHGRTHGCAGTRRMHRRRWGQDDDVRPARHRRPQPAPPHRRPQPRRPHRNQTPAKKTVPVDQIPPGNPASWVPAGVPTTAKYKEPGDVVPKIHPSHVQEHLQRRSRRDGLLLRSRQLGRRNRRHTINLQAFLSNGLRPRGEILTATDCSPAQHYQGGRYISGSPTIIPHPKGHGATWAGQFHVTVARGKLLGTKGQIVSSFKKICRGNGIGCQIQWKALERSRYLFCPLEGSSPLLILLSLAGLIPRGSERCSTDRSRPGKPTSPRIVKVCTTVGGTTKMPL